MRPEVYSDLLIAYALIAGAFFSHAFQVMRLSRTEHSVPYTGVVPMSLAAAAYNLSLTLYAFLSSPTSTRANAHLMWFCGTLMLYFHVTALEAFFGARVRWLAWVKRLILIQALITAISALMLVGFGKMFVFSNQPMVPGVAILTLLIDRANRDRLLRIEHSIRLAQIGELTATLAHELHSPLTAITVNAQYGLRQLAMPGPEKVSNLQTIFTGILTSCHKMTEIAGSLRRHAHVSQTEETSFAPEAAVREAVQLIGRAYQLENIRVSCEISEGLPKVRGDSGPFQQVLINLLQNAKDATEGRADREIRISADRVQGDIRIRVKDNGSGIAPEILAKIFQPFFTTKSRDKGTGIGLSFASPQIKSMGGQIRVESEPDRGSTFELRFPAATS